MGKQNRPKVDTRSTILEHGGEHKCQRLWTNCSDPLEEVASNLGHKRVMKSAHMKQQSKILAFRWASESECTWGWLVTDIIGQLGSTHYRHRIHEHRNDGGHNYHRDIRMTHNETKYVCSELRRSQLGTKLTRRTCFGKGRL